MKKSKKNKKKVLKFKKIERSDANFVVIHYFIILSKPSKPDGNN